MTTTGSDCLHCDAIKVLHTVIINYDEPHPYVNV